MNKEKQKPEKPGKILKIKQGYNPNSSSIGSIIFVLPVALLSSTAIFAVVSSVLYSVFLQKKLKRHEKQGHIDKTIESTKDAI